MQTYPEYILFILVILSVLISYFYVYRPHLKVIYQELTFYRKANNIGMELGAMGIGFCMFLILSGQYLIALTTYLISIALFISCLYIDISVIDKKKKGKEESKQLLFPQQTIANNKLIFVKGLTGQEVERMVKDFCRMYNTSSYKAIVKIQMVEQSEYALTFPYDIDFNTFCFLVNYAVYPMDINKKPNVYGWIPKERDNMTETMFYIPIDDSEHNNVYCTTTDGKYYKIDFGTMRPKEIAKGKAYQSMPFSKEELSEDEKIIS